jgi:hypothetical protein
MLVAPAMEETHMESMSMPSKKVFLIHHACNMMHITLTELAQVLIYVEIAKGQLQMLGNMLYKIAGLLSIRNTMSVTTITLGVQIK